VALNIPDLEFSFVRRDVIRIEVLLIGVAHRKDGLFVPKDNGPYAGETRSHLDDFSLHVLGEEIEMLPCLRPRAYETHIAPQDIPKLRDFIDLGGPEDSPDRQDARIVLRREDSPGQIRAVFEHGDEFAQVKHMTFVADSWLAVKDAPFPRAAKDNGDCDQ